MAKPHEISFLVFSFSTSAAAAGLCVPPRGSNSVADYYGESAALAEPCSEDTEVCWLRCHNRAKGRRPEISF